MMEGQNSDESGRNLEKRDKVLEGEEMKERGEGIEGESCDVADKDDLSRENS
jgi:hypothetical protein